MGIDSSIVGDDTVLLLVGAILIILLCRGLRSYFRLRAFRGPFLAATSKLWILKAVYSKNLHLELKKVCDKYGQDHGLNNSLICFSFGC